MNTVVTVAVWLLAGFALIRASLIEPPQSSRTASEYRSTFRAIRWWHPAYWVAAIVLAVPVFTAWSALRFALYLAAFVAAALSVRLATLTSMDGRRIRIYRAHSWGEVRP
jgi:hypothetical protein